MASSNSGSRSSGRPSSGRSSSNRSSSSGSGRPSSSGSRGGSSRSGSGRPSSSRSSSGRPSSGRPSAGGSRGSYSRQSSDGNSRVTSGRPSSGRPSSSRPSARSGSNDRSRPEDTRSERPRSDRSDRPRSDRTERPATGRNRRENPFAGDRPQASEDRRPSTRGGRPDRPSRAGRGASRTDDRTGRSDRAGRPERTGRPERAGRPDRASRNDERGSRPDRDRGRYTDRDERTPRAPRSEKRVNVQDPIIPDHITGNELPRSVRNELRTLPEGLALRVARHLVASGELMDINPELAWQHAKAALNKASRVGIVREAAAEAAYHAGHFAEALTEFRAARRMRGIKEYWPLMADCERALGRPKKAIEMAGDPIVASLDRATRVEMRIVAAGARSDLGQWEAALATLQCPELSTFTHESWAARIRYAYADILANMGHNDEAIEWFHRAAAVDLDQATDADARIKELEGSGYDVFEGQDQVLEYEDLEDDEFDY